MKISARALVHVEETSLTALLLADLSALLAETARDLAHVPAPSRQLTLSTLFIGLGSAPGWIVGSRLRTRLALTTRTNHVAKCSHNTKKDVVRLNQTAGSQQTSQADEIKNALPVPSRF